MRVIDLYVLISKKEYDKLPDKIKYRGCIYNLEIDEDFINYNPQDNGIWLLNQFLCKLNDEIEIIKENAKEPQEHKIPEKLNYPHIEIESSADDEIRDYLYKVKDKIDEILDYLEEKE